MNNSNPTDTFIETPDGRLFARFWGSVGRPEAPTIILFHDSLGSVDQWRDFPCKLAAATGRPVIAYDRLGFGRSDPNPRRLEPDFVRNEASAGLAHIREAFAVDHMILFGHSVGGGMAIASGATFATETDAVITLAAQAFVEDRTIAGIEQAREMFRDEKQIGRLARYHGGKTLWVLDAWIETWLAPAFADWCLDDDLRRLNCPILALHGDLDEYGSRAHPDRIAALAGGGAQEVLLTDCHHMPHREMPDEVLRLVRDFTSKVLVEARDKHDFQTT